MTEQVKTVTVRLLHDTVLGERGVGRRGEEVEVTTGEGIILVNSGKAELVAGDLRPPLLRTP